MTTLLLAPPRDVALRSLALPFAATIAGAIAFVSVMRLAVHATLPTWAVSILAPTVLAGLVFAVFRCAATLGAVSDRPILKRHGFAVVVIGACLALPMLGAFSLVDPWETHYAEVAREMIERRDFVSPWWANEGWFMSKPVLTFWLEAIAMAVFGVHTGPNEILEGSAHPEWAVRFPTFALALIASYVLYHGVSRTCGRRAGFLGAIALWTMPGYALLSHQAITDMPMIACIAASLGLLLRAIDTPDEAHVTRISLRLGSRAIVLHAGHALSAIVVALTVPQLAMVLGSSHFAAGSPHACGLPSQPPCAPAIYAHPHLHPATQALLFAPIVFWLVSRIAGETKKARLFALGAWGFAAVAAMAKGPAGLVIPVAAVLVVLAAKRSLRPLLRLEIASGLLLALVLIAPWYVAVWARHGRVFLDELVMRHMLGRTLEHLHDTNDGEDVGIVYFVKQLGYATFPWSGILAAAVCATPSKEDGSRRGIARTLLFGAGLFSFALVSAMRTKFHHYVLIAVPPFAMLVGIWLDERLEEARSSRGKARFAATTALAIGAACVVGLVALDFAGSGAAHFVQLFTYRYNRHWVATTPLAPVLVAAGVVMTLATFAFAVRRWRGLATGAMVVVTVAFSAFLLDVYLVRAAPNGGQREILDAYYRDKGTNTGPLVAYQLNWKGENFYTGNDVAIFISSGAPMKTWLEARRRGGQHTFYFALESGRTSGLRSELGQMRTFDVLTTDRDSAEFSLVRADFPPL